jgi:hypothetical protein
MHANQLCTEIDPGVCFRKPAQPSLLSLAINRQLRFLLNAGFSVISHCKEIMSPANQLLIQPHKNYTEVENSITKNIQAGPMFLKPITYPTKIGPDKLIFSDNIYADQSIPGN